MKLYVAAHCRWAGSHVAAVLSERGHQITARWLSQPFGATTDYTPETCRDIAQQDMDDVCAADGLVLVAGPDRYSGGKFVEVGIALGTGKRVVVIGRRENMLMHHPSVEQVDTPEAAAERLR
jgi:nucleoside 2-deoxyribosyltransferase